MTSPLLALEPFLRLGAFGLALGIMTLWELVAPQRAPRQSRTLRWSANLGVAAISALLARLAVPMVPVGAAALAADRSWGLLAGVPGWISWLITFVVLDLAVYFQHRLTHAIPLLWRLHRMHHTDLEVDATTGLRFHPLEILFSLAIKVAVVLTLGAPPVAVMVFEIALNAAAIFNHGNVRLPAGIDRLLRLVLVTPAMHRVHHSIVRAETDSNFGFSVPWWDRLFGTYRAAPAAGLEDEIIGLPIFRGPGASRLDRILIQPFVAEQP
jgi:sterol desaturase/sphingolipid hydroxylase (fatty acid hydroxylase superfamily)